jgi:hypothetical protein
MSEASVSRRKPGTTPLGQQRTVAFENLIPEFRATSRLRIEILDPEFQPISDAEFKTKKPDKQYTTDETGHIKVDMPDEQKVELLLLPRLT